MELKTGFVLYEKEGIVAKIILNRPEKRNSINVEMFDEIAEAIRDAENDDQIKVIIFKGNGPAFCAGLDLNSLRSEYGQGVPKPGEKAPRPLQRTAIYVDRKRMQFMRALFYCMKHTLAQVHGYCYGYGMMIAEQCDFCIASEETKFGHPEARIGGGQGTWTMPLEILTVGPKRAKELVCTGRTLSAKEAEQWGLINRAVPADKLEEEVSDLVKALSVTPRDGVAIGKAWAHAVYEMLGLSAPYSLWYGVHPQAMNARFTEEPGSFNFFKAIRDKGMKGAIQERDSLAPKRYR